MKVRAHAPGRVNLIGDHTDYTGGLVCPMAIDLGTTVVAERTGSRVALASADDAEPAIVELDVDEPSRVEPPWARYVAGVVAELSPAVGIVGQVRTTLPIGGGLSSSAALEVAVALALGFEGSPLELALLCQRAEHRAAGVPCGVMDQLASTMGVEGHALAIDCHALTVDPFPLPSNAEVIIIDSQQSRSLATSEYAARRSQCEAAEAVIGPLRGADLDDLAELGDSAVKRRARHVITENARVGSFAEAMRNGDLAGAGALMAESHFSLRDDFEVSTPVLDDIVAQLLFLPGVYGARLTGGGFGGSVVALVDRGMRIEGRKVTPVAGATAEILGA